MQTARSRNERGHNFSVTNEENGHIDCVEYKALKAGSQCM